MLCGIVIHLLTTAFYVAHAHFNAKVLGRAIPCHTVGNTSIVTERDGGTQTHLALLLRAERQAFSSHGGGQLATDVELLVQLSGRVPMANVIA